MRSGNGSKARDAAKPRNTDHGSRYGSTKSGGISPWSSNCKAATLDPLYILVCCASGWLTKFHTLVELNERAVCQATWAGRHSPAVLKALVRQTFNSTQISIGDSRACRGHRNAPFISGIPAPTLASTRVQWTLADVLDLIAFHISVSVFICRSQPPRVRAPPLTESPGCQRRHGPPPPCRWWGQSGRGERGTVAEA